MKKCPKCDHAMFAGIICDECNRDPRPRIIKCQACHKPILMGEQIGGWHHAAAYCANVPCVAMLSNALKAEEQATDAFEKVEIPDAVVEECRAEVVAELSQDADKRAIQTATAILDEGMGMVPPSATAEADLRIPELAEVNLQRENVRLRDENFNLREHMHCLKQAMRTFYKEWGIGEEC